MVARREAADVIADEPRALAGDHQVQLVDVMEVPQELGARHALLVNEQKRAMRILDAAEDGFHRSVPRPDRFMRGYLFELPFRYRISSRSRPVAAIVITKYHYSVSEA